MRFCFLCCILILSLATIAVPVTAAISPTINNVRLVTTTAPPTIISCPAPCQCLAYSEAVSQWGANGFTQCAELPCEISRSATGAPVEKHCYRQKQQAPLVTTTLAQVTGARTQPTQVPTTQAQISGTRTQSTPGPTTQGQVTQIPAISPLALTRGTFTPLVINVGKTQKSPELDASSPYFARQFAVIEKTVNANVPVTFSYLEVNYYSGVLPSYSDWPGWDDHQAFVIDTKATNYPVNFRWVTAEKDVKGALFQISRFPFPAESDNWQNQYVPGIVGSGQVKEGHSEYDEEISTEYRYFQINFARAANRNPGLPPYFDGVISLDQDNQGIGEVQQVTRIPVLNTGIIMKEYSVGSFNFGLPAGFVSMASDDMTQYELGNPNANLKLSCTDCINLRKFTPLETTVSGTEQIYYVRIVPIHADGKAGKPTLPVTVTVKRPHPCPTGVTNVLINPPSAKVLSFIPTLFTPHEMFAGGPGYFVAIKDPDNCTQKTFSLVDSGSTGSGFGAGLQTTPTPDPTVYGKDSPCYGFMNTAHGQVGYHWYVPPEQESHWYDFLPKFLQDFFAALEIAVNGLSLTWNMIQAFAADLTAKVLSYTLTFGAYRCDQEPKCLGVIESAQAAVLAAYGIPPTIPTFDELSDAGAGYMIKIAADQLGAGALYEGLPDDVKQKMIEGTQTVASEVVNGQRSATKDQLASSVGSWFMPDPLYNYPHPATAIVRVYNPAGNLQPTSRAMIQITDSEDLYKPSRQMIVPPLAPGEGVAIPVILEENYEPFKDHPETCPNDYQNNLEYPCYMWKWLVHRNNQVSSDTLSVSVQYQGPASAAQDSFTLNNLNPDSNGKKLTSVLQLDPEAQNGVCSINSVITYPLGWTMKLDSRAVDPEIMDSELFTDTSTNGIIRTTCKFPEVC
jgi:hypothetical protein